jgi:hypothetical protein
MIYATPAFVRSQVPGGTQMFVMHLRKLSPRQIPASGMRLPAGYSTKLVSVAEYALSAS